MTLPKVLVAAPISKAKDYCMDEWVQQVKSFDYPYYDIYLVDNSHDKDYHKKIWDYGMQCDHIDPQDHPAPIFITQCQNAIRQVFLESGYDFLLSLECDVFVHKQIIQYLLHFRELNIGLPYFLYSGEKTALSFQDLEEAFNNKRMRKCSQEETMYIYDGSLQEKYIPALGCTMIHRSVLEKIAFRVDLKANRGAFSDTFFQFDCKRLGIPTLVDTSMMAEHRRTGWETSFDYYKK